MKKFFYKIICGAVSVTLLVILLNTNATTKQGINYEQHTITMPLYLKVLDFFDRHYNYKALVKRIIKDAKTDQERIMRIFAWTSTNMRKNSADLPVVDDHVWHIIVRGYGVDDQFQDVFTTLCNYAKFEAFFDSLFNKDRSRKKCFSFVNFNNRWVIFDAYNGAYFKTKDGQIANVEDLLSSNWKMATLNRDNSLPDYSEYFQNLNKVDYKNWEFQRSAIQSPFRRFIFWKRYKK